MTKWLKRYVSVPLLAVLAFMVFLLFFNENSVKQSYEYAAKIRSLQQRIAAANDTLNLYKELNRRLDCDPQELERIVREYYHMQRSSEDVYIFD